MIRGAISSFFCLLSLKVNFKNNLWKCNCFLRALQNLLKKQSKDKYALRICTILFYRRPSTDYQKGWSLCWSIEIHLSCCSVTTAEWIGTHPAFGLSLDDNGHVVLSMEDYIGAGGNYPLKTTSMNNVPSKSRALCH